MLVTCVHLTSPCLLCACRFAALEARHRAQAERLANVAGAVAEAAHVRLLKFLNHELRNPLAVVIACVDQMLASPSWCVQPHSPPVVRRRELRSARARLRPR